MAGLILQLVELNIKALLLRVRTQALICIGEGGFTCSAASKENKATRRT